MWGLSKIDRIQGAVVGTVFGTMPGAALVLGFENLGPGSTHWYHWVIFMPPGAIVGLVFGLLGGVKSIFHFR
ncbi:MAG: hypothetical protein JOZ08_20140 [Verrucomicrobia bacterium]|nr:hypothetical protein [Verrucomicrobiota bacterium]